MENCGHLFFQVIILLYELLSFHLSHKPKFCKKNDINGKTFVHFGCFLYVFSFEKKNEAKQRGRKTPSMNHILVIFVPKHIVRSG